MVRGRSRVVLCLLAVSRSTNWGPPAADPRPCGPQLVGADTAAAAGQAGGVHGGTGDANASAAWNAGMMHHLDPVRVHGPRGEEGWWLGVVDGAIDGGGLECEG